MVAGGGDVSDNGPSINTGLTKPSELLKPSLRTATHFDQCLDDGEDASNSLSEHVSSCAFGDGDVVVVGSVVEDVVIVEINVANCSVSVNTDLTQTNCAQQNRDYTREESSYLSTKSN